ncbi:MAG: rhodanese-like domain-containing protein [Verrucomicrobiota bacterium]
MRSTSISPTELAARLQTAPDLTVIDVRTPAEFAELHAVPARNLPLPDATPEALASLGHGDRAKPVYILCQSGKRAETCSTRLAAAGFAEAVVVTGGTEAWAAANLPVVRGEGGGIGLERQVRIVAGALVFTGAILSATVHPAFVWLSGFVGAGLMFAGITGFCGMGLLMAKAPWNRR